MKKSKEQPIGIVISTGQSSPGNPKIRAYFWCDVETPDPSHSEEGAVATNQR